MTYNTYTFLTVTYMYRRQQDATRNSSGDEIANVNFLYDNIVHAIQNTPCSKKSDAKIQITITTAHLIRINYPLKSFNRRLSGTNFANFNKIQRTVSEQQLFEQETHQEMR